MTALVGVTSGTPVKAGDKYRATWQYFFSSILPGSWNGAVGDSLTIREWLPSQGFVPFSPVATIPGAESIVYDVRLSLEWGAGNKTVADIVRRLAPPFPLVLSMRLVTLERVSYTSATQMQQQQADAVTQAEQAADTNAAFDAAKAAWDKLAALLGVAGKTLAVAVVVVAGVATYVYLKKRK